MIEGSVCLCPVCGAFIFYSQKQSNKIFCDHFTSCTSFSGGEKREDIYLTREAKEILNKRQKGMDDINGTP